MVSNCCSALSTSKAGFSGVALISLIIEALFESVCLCVCVCVCLLFSTVVGSWNGMLARLPLCASLSSGWLCVRTCAIDCLVFVILEERWCQV